MRIIKIRNNQALIEVNETELDMIVNNYLDKQYTMGYDTGFEDWKKAYYDADVDNDDPKEN